MTSALHLLLLSFTLLLVRPTTGDSIPEPLQKAYHEFMNKSAASPSTLAEGEALEEADNMTRAIIELYKGTLKELNIERHVLEELKRLQLPKEALEKLQNHLTSLQELYKDIQDNMKKFERGHIETFKKFMHKEEETFERTYGLHDPKATFPPQEVPKETLKRLKDDRRAEGGTLKGQLRLHRGALQELKLDLEKFEHLVTEALEEMDKDEKLNVDEKKLVTDSLKTTNTSMLLIRQTLKEQEEVLELIKATFKITLPSDDPLFGARQNMNYMRKTLQKVKKELEGIDLNENIDILMRDDMIYAVDNLVERLYVCTAEAEQSWKPINKSIRSVRHGVQFRVRNATRDIQKEFKIIATVRAEMKILWEIYEQIKRGYIKKGSHSKDLNAVQDVQGLTRLIKNTINVPYDPNDITQKPDIFSSYLAATDPNAPELQHALRNIRVSSHELSQLRDKAAAREVTIELLSAINDIVAAFERENIFDRADDNIKYLAKAKKIHHCSLIAEMSKYSELAELKATAHNATAHNALSFEAHAVPKAVSLDEVAANARGLNRRRRRHKRARKGRRAMKHRRH